MEQKTYFFAVDLGATSGRTILGSLTPNHLPLTTKVQLEELTRFPNNLIEQGGHFYWDIYALYFEIIRGLKEVARRGIQITSIGIDTWGVDFVFIGSDNAILRNPRAYRDPITFAAMDDYLENVISRREVYDITGIQLMNFNSIFQLYAMRKEDNAAFRHARKILFVPDALSWMLTGQEVCEYTIASTSQLLDPRTKELDARLLQSVGLTREKFGRMVMPGSQIGVLTDEVQRLTGLGPVPVIAVAGHDTGSAVAAVPARDENFAYLSSGTWSLMGIETRDAIISDLSYERNFTNEGGIDGTTRFLKNICGMWLYERCRLEWQKAPLSSPEGDTNVQQGNEAPSGAVGEALSHAVLQSSAMTVEPFRSLINPDDQAFAAPTSRIEAIQQYCRDTNQSAVRRAKSSTRLPTTRRRASSSSLTWPTPSRCAAGGPSSATGASTSTATSPAVSSTEPKSKDTIITFFPNSWRFQEKALPLQTTNSRLRNCRGTYSCCRRTISTC